MGVEPAMLGSTVTTWANDEALSLCGEEDVLSVSTMPQMDWYPSDSMELDAILAQELRHLAMNVATNNSNMNAPAMQTGSTSFCMNAQNFNDWNSSSMSLSTFLEEDVPTSPISQPPYQRAGMQL